MTTVEWLENEFSKAYDKNGIVLFSQVFDIIQQAKVREHEKMKRVALHFIVLGGQECGCNWNEINFTDEFNKVINR